MSRAFKIALPIILFSVIFDQATKIYMRVLLEAEPNKTIEVFSVLDWRLLYNPGISFSLFENIGGSRWLLTILAVLVAAVLIWTLRELRSGLYTVGVALIAGGAIGNAIDRVYIGAVVDFIDLHWGAFHPFIFNIADAAISFGVVCLLLDMFFGESANR